MTLPLDGTTVLDLTSGPAGAFAGMLLGDSGARVLRAVHAAAPLHRSGGFAVWDRGKEAFDWDPEAAGAEDALARLLPGADVLLQDFAPSAPQQAMVAPAKLRASNPRLVACSITAYGMKGRWRDDPPVDDLAMARAGILSGMPGFRPAPVHVPHPLPSTGAALFACIGAAAGLLARETTGRGRIVETSLLAGALLFHPKVVAENIPPLVFQTHPSGSAPFYSLYACADGEYIQLGCVHERFISRASEIMGIGDLVAEPRFQAVRRGDGMVEEEELRDAIAGAMKTRNAADWAADFEAADVPFAPVRQGPVVLDDPQIHHNAMVLALEDPAVGEAVQMGAPIRFAETPADPKPRAAVAGPAPDLPPLAAVPASAADGVEDPPPLAGVRVLEITNLIAGPTGGRLLADLGADVIKLEPPGGDISRPIGRNYFYNLNFNKRSLCIDARKPGGKEAIQRVAAGCDIMLANLRPGATHRMGIGAHVDPKLIEAHVTGYGLTGPYSKRPGIDPLAQALMGLSRAQGGSGNPPSFAAQLAPTDFTAGAMATLGSILALYSRRQGGAARRVDSNLLNAAVVLSSPWFGKWRGKAERPLADTGQHGIDAFHRLYRVADGWIYVAADTQEARAVLTGSLGLGALDPAGEGHPAESPLARAMAEAFAGRRLEEALAALQEAGVPAAEARGAASELFLDDDASHANALVTKARHPTAGRMRIAWNYVRFRDTATSAGRPTPLLGEHSADVLAEAGVDAGEIEALFASGAVLAERG